MTDEGYYVFSAHSSETVIGYGVEAQAIKYRNYLNRGREINLYQYELEIEEKDGDFFDLTDAINELNDQTT